MGTPLWRLPHTKSTTFSESSGPDSGHLSFLMVVPRIWVPIPKTRVNCPNVKNNLFLHFLVSLCKKISSGWQSDNFDPRRSAYGSSESFCPIFFKTPAEKVIIFKNVGASPLQSQVIQNCVPQNRCFLSIFF